jgi:murein DD-endopeptidase MepM/ murein hydrolase activator NlpD
MRALRRILLFLLAAVIAGGLARDQIQSLASHPSVRRLLVPFRAAALASKAPDAQLAMPLASVRVRQVANTWHGARAPNRKHEGQDIFASRGTPVYSATSGIVMRVAEGGIGGKTVSVLGAGGRTYYYAHFSAFAPISLGDPVTTATVLGYVGNTGNARTTPPHLHFGVYTRSGAIDPLPLLVDRAQPPVSTATE